MKKTWITVLGLVVVGGGLLTYIEGEKIDRFNPFKKEKDVYVLTKEKAEPDGRLYYYELSGVDISGKENTIKVRVSGKNDYSNSYLKVHVKGKYVYKIEEVQEKEIPEKAKEKLKK
ncbi:hypothetical protein COL39_15640 [Bacillus cereus]|uniref:YxeA family protein n=1 Tax=Bacillus cereus TaxID=1396 RepID=UPI000BF4DA7A|nr:YxeA family protein [Bacillus cereus]PFX73167.1 hypothetical protein COL39_15640 [Bacillus cereus]